MTAGSELIPQRSVVVLVILSIFCLFIGLLVVIYLYQDRIIFFPERLSDDFRFEFRQEFEEIQLQPAKGVLLDALFFPANPQKGIILYFHGNAGSLAGWGEIAQDFLDQSFSVLIPDYRTFGKSRGPLSEDALYSDAEIWYDYLRERYAENEIIVYGRSIGTGIATEICAKHRPRMLILESPFTNLRDVAKVHYGIFSFIPLRFNFPNSERINRIRVPTILFHGSNDEIIPVEQSEKLSRLKDGVDFYRISGGGHNNLRDFPAYQNALRKVLDQQSKKGK